MALDAQVLEQFLPPAPDLHRECSPIIADFGCGTGRIARLLQPKGYRILNIDLSLPMLHLAGQDLREFSAVARIQANLAQLDCLRDQSLDFGVCFYSSLGMIRGRQHRLSFLKTVHRCLKPNCRLILHVHNRYHRSYQSIQLAWLLRSRMQSLRSGQEFGDRLSSYRGLPKMFLHIFSRREIVHDVRAAGFSEIDVLPIDGTSSKLLAKQAAFIDLRAGGFFVIGQR